ncbi:MAG: DUF6148 family protein [Cetobacterium sp.]
MSYFSVEMCTKKLEIWLKAEEAIALAQEYEIEGRKIRRVDLGEVQKMIEIWEKRLNKAKLGGASTLSSGVPLW